MRLVSDEVRDLRSLLESCLKVLVTLRDDPLLNNPELQTRKVTLMPDVVDFVNAAEAAYKDIR